VRERMDSKVKVDHKKNKILINLTHSLDPGMYDMPLTLKTYVSPNWKNVLVKQKTKQQRVQTQKDADGIYILYQAIPNNGAIEISKSE